MMHRIARLPLCLIVLALTGTLRAQDTSWYQWGGPNRDHKSTETGLLKSWPADGPKKVWEFTDAGFGYSSFSVKQGRLYTLGTVDGQNQVICLDASNGTLVWRYPIGEALPESSYNQAWAGGPRSTPTIAGDKVVATDDGGRIVCLQRETGTLVWQASMVEMGGKIPKWGYSASPLVDGDRVVVCPGGENFLVALDLNTGKQVLSSTGYTPTAHYVSVVKQTVGSTDCYITASAEGLVSFSAETGDVLWTNNSSGNSVATIPTPTIRGDLVYHTSDYGTGCVLVRVKETPSGVDATEIYTSKNMQNHHGGVVLLGDSLFGFKRKGGWVCQDFMTGDVKWTKRMSGDGSVAIAYADDRLYLFGESTGTCYLIEPSDEEWIEKGKLNLPRQTGLDRQRGKIWSHPVIAEGKLFLRDMDLIYAFDIKD